MKASDIMTPMPAAVTPSTKVFEAAEVMKYEEVGCIPVVSDIVSRRLVGIITDRDISIRCTARRHGVGCEVGKHMTPLPLQTVVPDEDVAQVVAKMESARVRRIPVVDGQGSLVESSPKPIWRRSCRNNRPCRCIGTFCRRFDLRSHA